MTWTARGKTAPEISIILSMSGDTVKKSIESCRRKLNAANKTQAATIAVVLGLITPFECMLPLHEH